MASAMATGSIIGTGTGGLGGAILGGGPEDVPAVLVGARIGMPVGSTVGTGFGYLKCGTGGGGAGGGGGGGRASGSSARLTKPQQRQTAEYLGMKEVKGLTSQGQPVFEKGGRYFSFSNTSHTAGEVFKELDRNGNRIATTDLNFTRIGP